jgi:hypothetical protein
MIESNSCYYCDMALGLSLDAIMLKGGMVSTLSQWFYVKGIIK